MSARRARLVSLAALAAAACSQPTAPTSSHENAITCGSTRCVVDESGPGLYDWRNCQLVAEDPSYRAAAIPGIRNPPPLDAKYVAAVRRAATVANELIWNEPTLDRHKVAAAFVAMHANYTRRLSGSSFGARWLRPWGGLYTFASKVYFEANLSPPLHGPRGLPVPRVEAWALPNFGYAEIHKDNRMTLWNDIMYQTLDVSAFPAAFETLSTVLTTIKGRGVDAPNAVVDLAYITANMWIFDSANWGFLYVLVEQARERLGLPPLPSDGLDYWMMLSRDVDAARTAYDAWQTGALSDALDHPQYSFDAGLFVRRVGFAWDPNAPP